MFAFATIQGCGTHFITCLTKNRYKAFSELSLRKLFRILTFFPTAQKRIEVSMSLIENIRAQSPAMIAYLAKLGYRRYDVVVTGDRFPEDGEDDSQYSDYSGRPLNTCLNQAAAAEILAKLLGMDEADVQMFTWIAGSYKPQPEAQSLHVATRGELGHTLYAGYYRQTAPSFLPQMAEYQSTEAVWCTIQSNRQLQRPYR